MFWRADRRNHLRKKSVRIAAVDPQIRRSGLNRKSKPAAARSAHDFKPLSARQVNDIEMGARDTGEINRGLNCERLSDSRVRILPVRQCTLGLVRLEFVARPIDQRAGFAVNAGDGIRSKRCDRAEAF
jgi:hypothetical protein